MDRPRTAELTAAQRECLRLVLKHHNSKEIAALLGVSPSAVDKRIERAVQLTGTSSRFAAARLLAEDEETGTMPAYDRLPSEPIDVPTRAPDPTQDAMSGPGWLVRRLLGLAPVDGAIGRTRNSLGRLQRLGAVAVLVVFIAVTSMALLDMGQTLSRVALEYHFARSR